MSYIERNISPILKDRVQKSKCTLVVGARQVGKSTLIKFIINSFYGISKNKKGKEFSDYQH